MYTVRRISRYMNLDAESGLLHSFFLILLNLIKGIATPLGWYFIIVYYGSILAKKLLTMASSKANHHICKQFCMVTLSKLF